MTRWHVDHVEFESWHPWHFKLNVDVLNERKNRCDFVCTKKKYSFRAAFTTIDIFNFRKLFQMNSIVLLSLYPHKNDNIRITYTLPISWVTNVLTRDN